jgi:hypothetical protein
MLDSSRLRARGTRVYALHGQTYPIGT